MKDREGKNSLGLKLCIERERIRRRGSGRKRAIDFEFGEFLMWCVRSKGRVLGFILQLLKGPFFSYKKNP